MSKGARWCVNNKYGRKRVVYNPHFYSKYEFEEKPFECLNCGRRHSHKDLGLVRGKASKQYISPNIKHNNLIAKMLRQQCHIVFMKKNRLQNEKA